MNYRKKQYDFIKFVLLFVFNGLSKTWKIFLASLSVLDS